MWTLVFSVVVSEQLESWSCPLFPGDQTQVIRHGKPVPLPAEPALWPSRFYMVQDYCPKNGSTHNGKPYLSWGQNNSSLVTIDLVKLTASQTCLVSWLAYAHPLRYMFVRSKSILRETFNTCFSELGLLHLVLSYIFLQLFGCG